MLPQLPVELFEQIISTAWHLPLSSSERTAFMKHSALVNSTWAALFDMISSRDVYILSSAFADHFLQRLRTQPPPPVPAPYSFLGGLVCRLKKSSHPVPKPRSANLACRSISIQIRNLAVHPDKHNRTHLPMAAVLDEILEHLDAHSLAPNLRHISIECVDVAFDDVFRRIGLAALPPQIKHLELRYSYNAEMPPWLATALREKQEQQRYFKWVARDIQHLTVFGVGENTVRDFLRECPNVQTLDGDCEGIKL